MNLFFLFFIHSFNYAQNPDGLIEVSIFSEVEKISQGKSSFLLLEINLKPEWHVYWKTAGETGYPTSVKWNLPEGVKMGNLLFPVPDLYEYQDLISYIHKDKIYLLCEIEIRSDVDFKDDIVSISGEFSCLVCSEENCIPFDQDLSIDIPLSRDSVLDLENQDIFQSAREQFALPFSDEGEASAILYKGRLDLYFEHSLISDLPVNEFKFFPEGDFFIHGKKQKFDKSKDGKVSLSLWTDSSGEQFFPNIDGILSHPELESGLLVDLSVDKVSFGNPNNGKIASNPIEVVKIKSGLKNLALVLGFILIAMAIWAYGKTGCASKISTRSLLIRLLSIILLLGGIWLAYPISYQGTDDEIFWDSWSPEKEKSLLNEGRAVFIDFTAKWCMSCQVNKAVYRKESVIKKFKELKIATLQADWTKRGPIILKALQQYGREGVPLYVYHPPRQKGESTRDPILLPEVLTKEIVLDVVEKEKPYFETKADSFWGILGFAFLGGIILNLMPCVFPVLGLKIMSFVKKAGEDASKVRNHGIIFTFGVLLSFWILVGVLLFLRERLQSNLGWGFQLQEPNFVFGLAVFLFIFALNLSGVFEIGMSFTGIGNKLSGKNGYIGSFFSGFLATIVATPCMAPFLGVAVGAALSMPWHSAFIIFTTIAIGLASPYLIFSLFPKWISRLPKPGAWMDTFKQAIAFPLYATVAWLLWTLGSLI